MKQLIMSFLGLVLFLHSCGSDGSTKNNYTPHQNVANESPDMDYMSPTEVAEGEFMDEIVSNEEVRQKQNNKVETDEINPANTYQTKIIKTADLKIKVDDVKKASSKMTNLVDMNGGYISSENLQSTKNYYQTIEKTEDYKIEEYEVVTSNVIYIRVPTQNFQKVLSGMKGIAVSEDYVRVDAQDVTEEYYDLETRLKTKKEVEKRYIEILRSKAKTVSEILTAEEKIRVIREEIEVVEGRLKYLKNKVNLSSIQVEMYQDPVFIQETIKYKKYQETGWSFWEKAGNAISTGWNAILNFLIGLLYVWPFLIIIGTGLWFLLRKFKRLKNK